MMGADLFNCSLTGDVTMTLKHADGNPAINLPTVVGTLSDGAHNGGGLTAKMPTPGAYSPCVANPLTARMCKGINTTLDEGQTAIVRQGEGRNDL
jgi:hypothetical protein